MRKLAGLLLLLLLAASSPGRAAVLTSAPLSVDTPSATVGGNTFIAPGTRLPNSDTTPSANAMSVAIGIPQPSPPFPEVLKAT